jgi:chromosome segregation ATPase
MDRRSGAAATEQQGGTGMASEVESALGRLERALDQLEAAAERRLSALDRLQHLEQENHTLSADRARLADSLDKSEARAAQLENANREVSRRLVAAVETIRSVLEPGAEQPQ